MLLLMIQTSTSSCCLINVHARSSLYATTVKDTPKPSILRFFHDARPLRISDCSRYTIYFDVNSGNP